MAYAAGPDKGPWLQGLGSTEVTVKVEFATPEAVRLEVQGPTGSPALVDAPSAKRLHALRASGLAPSTSYTYRVLAAEGAAELGKGRFTTAPAPLASPVDAKPFTFLAYGDSRSDPQAHAAVVARMLATPSDFLVNTGDLVATGDSARDWADFFRVEAPLLAERCVFVSVGNHELTNPTLQGADLPFLQYFAPIDEGRERLELRGSFRWGNARFFLLNAMDEWSSDDRAWLASELERAKGEAGVVHRIAIMHHGPFSSGRHGDNAMLKRAGVLDQLRGGGVDLVLAGHDHLYERGEGAGLKYIVTGGSGAPLYQRGRKSPTTAVLESSHHFVEVRVDGDKVRTLAHRAAGGVIDECSFVGDGSWDCGTTGPAKSSAASPSPSSAPEPASASCGCEAPGAGAGSGWVASFAFVALAVSRRRRRGLLPWAPRE